MVKKAKNNSLKDLRNKIDKIDKEIFNLIQERASHAVAIGDIKSKISHFYGE